MPRALRTVSAVDAPDLYEDHVRTLTERLRSILSAQDYDGLAIHSGRTWPQRAVDDQDWPLRPHPHLLRFAPLGWPGVVLTVGRDAPPTLHVHREESFWERRAEPDWSGFEKAGIQVVWKKQPFPAGAVLPRGERWAVLADRLGPDTLEVPSWCINPATLVAELDRGRLMKTPYEVANLREASARAARGHLAVRSAFEGGERSELRLHLLYLEATEQDDSETPYKNIVALGANAAILHHIDYGRGAPQAKSLLVDAGAGCRGYASDITRTYAAVEGAADFAALIASMDRVQQSLCEKARPPLAFERLHEMAHDALAEVLIEHGLYRGSAEACVEGGVTRAFFPHGLGHSLGLQVHDVGARSRAPAPTNAWLRNTRPIQAGQVFTIEPGLYFIDALLTPLRNDPAGEAIDWKRVDALAPFGGIRIEDNIAVFEDQNENLTRPHLPA